jgi:hypothetical protein
MKNFLLTWYGIADLSAALGLGRDGPVWNALKSGKYSDVVILGYTNKAKKKFNLGRAQKESLQIIAGCEGRGEAVGGEDRNGILDSFSNTEKSHRLFKKWLKEKISQHELEVAVKFYSVELAKLNDSAGISNAVRKCLDKVYLEEGEKRITVYVSPGTPIMAFNWAMAALTNPEMNIRIISSSDLSHGIEEIPLPHDLYFSKARKLEQIDAASKDFDVVFHLFGEQRIPSLLGVLQFRAKRHVFVTSGKFSSGIMKQFLKRGSKHEELVVDPFNPIDVKMKLLSKISEFPKSFHFGFNLTGGTKLMYSGAGAACRKINGIPFYFENRSHKLIYLHNFSSTDAVEIPSIDHFFRINGFKIIEEGKWADEKGRERRLGLTKFLWEKRRDIQKIYGDLSRKHNNKKYSSYVDNPSKPFVIPPDDRYGNFVKARLDSKGKASLEISGKNYTYNNFPDFARYLCGGWLEEYTYKLLEPMMERKKIKDMRIGMKVTWDSDVLIEGDYKTAQEFDVIFTDGKSLFIVECKAGAVKSEHVYKLSDCVRNYGGISARGILASAFSPRSPITKKRLSDSKNISHFCESNFSDMPHSLLR